MSPFKLPHVKICGLRTEDDVRVSVNAGARWLGFVHFENSPRHVTRHQGQILTALARELSPDVETVCLLVGTTPKQAIDIAGAMGADHIQLHGQETNMDIQSIRAGRPTGEIWKALPVAGAEDLKAVKFYPAADRYLFDAKPPEDADRPGGLGHSFDWSLLRGFSCARPWLLAGGLTPDTISDAIRISGAKALDVSSGVEREKGVKDAGLIKAFCTKAYSGA